MKPKGFKDSIRRLIAISKVFDTADFYNINLYSDQVNLQGYFNNNLVRKIKANKFKGEIAESGYVEFRRPGYNITLT